ncbi:beta-galactosidase [Streptomyces jeddahensis]|uniref:beta-galactosidase n=1 Tax=Streptomyces jeddahensis TaxID=1716141 RepID=A0A177HPW3_9ACTN|nr:beta-galactosidase [Streptomyces jeddahensis]
MTIGTTAAHTYPDPTTITPTSDHRYARSHHPSGAGQRYGRSAPFTGCDSLPGVNAGASSQETGELAAPVRLSYDGGHLRIHNRQHFRDLSWLAAEWVVSDEESGRRTAPAALPHVPPGGSAVVEPPAEFGADHGGGGEAWLTLRVTTAGVEPWAGPGTEVCTPQVRLRERPSADVPVPLPASSGPAVDVDAEGRLVHPLMTAPPVLSLWRAPTDNDHLGGVARRWQELGLDRLVRKPLSAESRAGRVTVLAAYATAAGTVEHQQVFSLLPDGGLLIEETAVLPEALTDVARVGTVFETVEGLDRMEWYGQGPWETYPDRAAGGAVGHHSARVDALFTPYLRPQESGGRYGVRGFSLRSDADAGLSVRLDAPWQVSVTHYRAADLASASHHDELVPLPHCVVHIDAAHRGLGTASCGPDTLPRYRVGSGVHRWAWVLRVL